MDDRPQSSRITFDELMAEINKYQQPVKPPKLTQEQAEFLVVCREKKKMTWPVVAQYWKLRWPEVCEESLRKWYRDMGDK